MQIIAILANVIFLILFVPLFMSDRAQYFGIGTEMIVAAIAAPVLSMIALVLGNASIFDLIPLEIEARKATLRQRIAEAETKSSGNGIRD
jgi:nitrate/nitrite transporter NarK